MIFSKCNSFSAPGHGSTWIVCLMFLLTSCVAARPVDPRVTMVDHSLATKITITNVSSVVNRGGLMELQVTGTNQTSSYKRLEYKIEWLDQNNILIPTILSRWTTFPAYERSEFRFKAVAPKTTAADFRILIRKGNK